MLNYFSDEMSPPQKKSDRSSEEKQLIQSRRQPKKLRKGFNDLGVNSCLSPQAKVRKLETSSAHKEDKVFQPFPKRKARMLTDRRKLIIRDFLKTADLKVTGIIGTEEWIISLLRYLKLLEGNRSKLIAADVKNWLKDCDFPKKEETRVSSEACNSDSDRTTCTLSSIYPASSSSDTHSSDTDKNSNEHTAELSKSLSIYVSPTKADHVLQQSEEFLSDLPFQLENFKTEDASGVKSSDDDQKLHELLPNSSQSNSDQRIEPEVKPMLLPAAAVNFKSYQQDSPHPSNLFGLPQISQLNQSSQLQSVILEIPADLLFPIPTPPSGEELLASSEIPKTFMGNGKPQLTCMCNVNGVVSDQVPSDHWTVPANGNISLSFPRLFKDHNEILNFLLQGLSPKQTIEPFNIVGPTTPEMVKECAGNLLKMINDWQASGDICLNDDILYHASGLLEIAVTGLIKF